MTRRGLLRLSLAATVAASAPGLAGNDPAVEVRTRAGAVRGVRRGGVCRFLGIPFAADPVGRLRYGPPERAPAWDGVREALAFGPKPPQVAYPPMIAERMPELSGPGDACLTLNLWTPDPGAGGLPVVVWIPGGMYEYHGTGACPWYDGSAFARDGVVCVTINYRVGAEGFLYLGDGIANVGLLDQVAALDWVHESIAAFGGDADRVTVFGESAGALSVATLLSMPRAEGLFRRAIVQSGGAQHVSSADAALRIGRRLAELMAVAPERDAIGGVPVERMLQAQAALRAEIEARPDPGLWGEAALTGLPWQPAVDGEVVPEVPLERIRAGAGAGVGLMVGSNSEEHRLFLVPGGMIDTIPPVAVEATLSRLGLSSARAEGYRARMPEASSGDLLAAIMTEWYWRVPAMHLADAHAGPTWMYEFAWRSPAFGGRLGAAHSLEIPFVFDTLGRQTALLHGEAPPQALAEAMHGAWVAFAAGADPGWEGYGAGRRTMRFDLRPRVVDDPLAGARAIWEGVR
jgi:para-nitrobenzyl esterase